MVRIAAALILLLLPATAHAGVSCSTIDDPDQRALCRAQQTNSVGNCTAISDSSLRASCRARLTGKPNNCNTIWSSWERQKCLDEARRGK